MRKKLISFIVIIIIFSSLSNSQASFAPDQLELIKGSYIHGRIFEDIYPYHDLRMIFDYDSRFTIQNIFKLADINKNLVQLNITYDIITAPDIVGITSGMIIQRHHIIWEDNRSIAIPGAYYKVTNGSYSVTLSLLEYDAFNQMSNLNNSIINLGDGRIVGWNELLQMSALRYEVLILISYVSTDWEFLKQVPYKTQHAISPLVNIGDQIDYGWFSGEIIGEDLIFFDSNNYNVFKCHVPYSESPPIFVTDNSYYIRIMYETDFFYDRKTGLILRFQIYNETGHLFGFFEPDTFYIPKNNDETVFTIPLNFIIIPICLSFLGYFVYNFRRKRA
jgi:hypothetical protein